MSKIYDFVKECGAFFLLTEREGKPQGRPFGAIMEIGDKLYVATSNEKKVYQEIKNNSKVQILALKAGTRQWARVSGVANECMDFEYKRKMMEHCPILHKRYSSVEDARFALFEISVENIELYE